MSVDMSAARIVDVKSSLFMSEWKSIACNFSIWERGQTEQTHYKTNIRVCLWVRMCVCAGLLLQNHYTYSFQRSHETERKEKVRILMFVLACDPNNTLLLNHC